MDIFIFFFQAEDGIRDKLVTGVQTCALPICLGTEDNMGDTFSQFTTREGSMWAVMSRPDHAAPLGAELYLQVDDADAAYQTWKERGVDMVSEPHTEPFGRTFAFKDSDGRVLHALATP